MINNYFRGFHNKLITLLVVSTLIPVLIVGWYSISSSTTTLTKLSVEKIEQQTSDSADRSITFLTQIRQDVLFLSKTPPVQGIVRARENKGIDIENGNSSYQSWVERLHIIFIGIMETKNHYYKIRYLDETGKEMVTVTSKNGDIAITPPAELENQANRDYFIETMKLSQGDFYISPVEYNREQGKIEIPYTPIIRISTPIYNRQGKIKGMIIANVLAESFLKKFKKTEINSSQLLILNEEGYYLFHPDKQKEFGFEFNKDEKISRDYPEKIANQILSGGNGIISEGTDRLISYYTLVPAEKSKHNNSLIFVYVLPKNVAFASLESFKSVAINVTIVSLAIVLTVAIILVGKLVNLIRELTGVVSSFSVQVLSTIEEQERLSAQQSSSVHQTTVTVNELGVSSQKSAEQAESAAKGATQVLILTDSSNLNIQLPGTLGASLREKMAQIAMQMTQLSELLAQIGKVANLVSNLATQTNMLALNASVEAVRAGEQGKGFGVVASEIRKLADRSRTSAEEIDTLLANIHQATSSTLRVTDEGTKAVQSIFTSINDIAINLDQISANAKQQALAIGQVVDAMNALSRVAAETLAGTNQTKIGLQKLNEAALNLKAAV